MTTNIATMPLPTNAGPKPLIVAAGTGVANFAANAMPATNGMAGTHAGTIPTQPIATQVVATEGQWAYAVFKFVDPNNQSQLVELKDTIGLTYTFDGIAADDWQPGTFRVAALDASGNIMSDAPSDFYDSAMTIGTYSTGLMTGSGLAADNANHMAWAPVVPNATSSANSGTVYYKDASPLDPTSGTGIYGVVLAVRTTEDTRVEAGEHVKFKITQNSPSGSAFTQSNYTEATVNVTDFIAAPVVTATSTSGRNFDLQTLSFGGVGTGGNATVAETFDVATPGAYDTSVYGTTSQYASISGWNSTDKLNINFAGTSAPGLSLTNFGNLSPGVKNEAYLLTGLRALNGAQMNQGGIYLMQVADAGANVLSDAAGTFSTYVFVDTNMNGVADTTGTGDLLVKLVGVGVHSLQSTNFELVA